MILGRASTPEERRISLRNYYLFNLANGVSYICLGENILVLFAARLNAPDAVVSMLGAMLYIGFLMMPLGVKRTACQGGATAYADFWAARNLAALLTASAAFAARFSEHASWGILLVGSLLFYGCRAAGNVMGAPLVGDIATEEEAPVVIGRGQGLFNASATVMLVAITLATTRWHGVMALAAIIVFGACCGVGASGFLRGIRETGALRDAARAPLMAGMRAAWRNGVLRRFSLGWAALNIGIILVMPISMLALKRGCGLSDAAALLCVSSQFVASIGSSLSSGPLCRRFGPRQALLAAAAMLLAVPFAWLAMPASGTAATVAGMALFAWLGFPYTLAQTAASSYFLLACPDKSEQIAGSVALNLVSSAGAGLVGSALGSWLVTRAGAWALGAAALAGGGELARYRLYFLLSLVPCLAAFAGIWQMRRFVYRPSGDPGRHASGV